MKSELNLKKSFMNLRFRCAVSALMASVFGVLFEIRTAFAEESNAGTQVVEEVIDTVDATTAVASTFIKSFPVLFVRVLTAGLIILIGILTISLDQLSIKHNSEQPASIAGLAILNNGGKSNEIPVLRTRRDLYPRQRWNVLP